MMATRACPNCGSLAPGSFCPECGQKQFDGRIRLRDILHDFVDDQFGVNARTWHTLRALLFKPGLLSTEYFNGRIKRYITPFRLYLIASVAFFLCVNVFTMRSVTRDLSQQIAAARDTVRARGMDSDSTRHIGVTVGSDSSANWLDNVHVDFGNKKLTAIAKRHLDRLAALGPEEGTRRLVSTALEQAPRVMFVLLPMYALLLFAFFWRQRRYYVEHFVFALHFHSFVFLVLLPAFVLPIQGMGVAITVWLLAYAFFAMRRFYGQGWLMLAVKFFFLWFLYWVILTIGIVAAIFLVIATV